MGCVSSKNSTNNNVNSTGPNGNNNNVKDNEEVPDKQRRRLSVLKGGQTPTEPLSGERATNVQSNKTEALLELLPEGEKRFSLVGQQPLATQKEFEDKSRAIAVSPTLLASFGTGVNSQESDEVIDIPRLLEKEFALGYACRKGLKPESPNQDDFFILQCDNHCGIYGICDGHGPFGHEVSHFAHQLLPAAMLRSDIFKSNPGEAMRKAFLKTHSQAVKATERNVFDCSLSGTTCTVVYLDESNKVGYCAHVGDSRAVLCSRNGSNSYVASDLSVDHKPSNEKEKARIHANGGQVRCLAGDVNDRVFLKNRLYPGLAMSRSIGDLVGASAGVIAEPDITKFEIKEENEFIIIATDGIWEFISSQQACDIITESSPTPSPEEDFMNPENSMKAASKLAQIAYGRWIEEEGSVVDDITVILVWLGKGCRSARVTIPGLESDNVSDTVGQESEKKLIEH